jgi:hypothetical protein
MSAVHHDQPQRSWWTLPAKTSQHFSDEKSQKSGIKLNALASAMGFKSKKPHPAPLTIHEPLYPTARTVASSRLIPPPTSPSGRRPVTAPGRPPSNSVSSSHSRVDSLEPRTPEDPAPVRRNSLLTLSDADPFAAHVVALHSPSSDINRLSKSSAQSNESTHRISYASSSSRSFRLGGELSPFSAVVSPVSENGSSYNRLPHQFVPSFFLSFGRPS